MPHRRRRLRVVVKQKTSASLLRLGLSSAGRRGTRRSEPAIQGEIIGPGIQKNKYGLTRLDLRIFSLIDIDRYALVDRDLMLSAIESVGLTLVPQLGQFVLNHTIDDLVELAVGKSQLNPVAHREGLVFRPAQEVQDATLGGRLSFKVINPQFLLKYDE